MKIRTFRGCLGVVAILLSMTIAADAHTRKGTTLLQGTVSFANQSGDLYGNDDRTTIQLSPAVHYFVIDQLALGGKLNYLRTDQGNNTYSDMLIGPSLAYYFMLDGQVIPYLGGGVFLRTLSPETDFGTTRVSRDENGSAIQLNGGLAVFLKDHLALTPELSIGFDMMDQSGTTIMLGMGLAGLIYNPAHKHHP